MSSVERILAAFEEYLDLKRSLTASSVPQDTLPLISEAKKRAALALNEFVDARSEKYHAEQVRRKSSDTSRIEINSPNDSMEITWNEVAVLLDALNCPPKPLDENDSGAIINWMKVYSNWYKWKRMGAICSLTPLKVHSSSVEPEPEIDLDHLIG